MYMWDVEFFWAIGVDALNSRIWRDAIAVDNVDQRSRGQISENAPVR